MTWHKCPNCSGIGICSVPYIGDLRSNSVCTICNGAKIIHTVTGKPPHSKSELKRLDCQGIYDKVGIGKIEEEK